MRITFQAGRSCRAAAYAAMLRYIRHSSPYHRAAPRIVAIAAKGMMRATVRVRPCNPSGASLAPAHVWRAAAPAVEHRRSTR